MSLSSWALVHLAVAPLGLLSPPRRRRVPGAGVGGRGCRQRPPPPTAVSRVCSPLQLETAARKRERVTSDPRTTEQKQEKKRLKISKKPKDPDPSEKEFTPYDYSKSDFKAFAGEARTGTPGDHRTREEEAVG